jgi:hypothetical protein
MAHVHPSRCAGAAAMPQPPFARCVLPVRRRPSRTKDEPSKGLSSGPTMLATQVKRSESEMGRAEMPGGQSASRDFRSLMRRKVAARSTSAPERDPEPLLLLLAPPPEGTAPPPAPPLAICDIYYVKITQQVILKPLTPKKRQSRMSGKMRMGPQGSWVLCLRHLPQRLKPMCSVLEPEPAQPTARHTVHNLPPFCRRLDIAVEGRLQAV